MSLKGSNFVSNVSSLSKEERRSKSVATCVATAICYFVLFVFNVGAVACVTLSIACGVAYFLFAPKRKAKVRRKKEKKKLRSSLDEEYIAEFDREHEQV